MKRNLSLLLVLILLLSLLAGCGAKSANSSMDYAYGGEPQAMPETAPASEEVLYDETASEESGAAAVLPENQKLIRTVYMDAETLDMDPLMGWIEGRVAELGGYFEQKSIRRSGSRDDGSYYRYADLMIRIPAENLDSFVSQVGENANVTSTSETAEDVTLTYVSTQSRILALETEQTRLLELLESAETMEDLLTIEERLTDVRWELENYTSQLRVLDNQVNYSTVYLDISEVDAPTVMAERTVWQKIGDGIAENAWNVWDGLVNAFIWAMSAIPYLLPLAMVGGLVLLVLKLTLWRKKKPKNPGSDTPKT